MVSKEKHALLDKSLCPKCGGKEFIEKDHYGYYTQCFLCGHSRDLDELMEAPVSVSSEPLPRRQESCL